MSLYDEHAAIRTTVFTFLFAVFFYKMYAIYILALDLLLSALFERTCLFFAFIHQTAAAM